MHCVQLELHIIKILILIPKPWSFKKHQLNYFCKLMTYFLYRHVSFVFAQILEFPEVVINVIMEVIECSDAVQLCSCWLYYYGLCIGVVCSLCVSSFSFIFLIDNFKLISSSMQII